MNRRTVMQILATTLIVAAAKPAAWAALEPEESDVFNGQEAAPFSVRSVKGDVVSLKDCKGRSVLINFFASWCPPCREEIGELTQLHKEYSKRGLVVIGIAADSVLTPDTVDDVKPLVERLAIPYAVAIATKKIADDYHFKGIPTTIVIGADGKIAKTFYGYHDAKAIQVVLEKTLPPAESKTK